MRTKIIRLVLAGAMVTAWAVGPARAASTGPERPTGIVGTGAVIVPCHQYPNYGVLAPVYNRVHPTCPDGTKPVVLSIVAPDDRHAYASLCDPGVSWCVHGLHGSPWTSEPTRLYCSVVVDRTWYGLMGAGSDGHPSEWWMLKVIDGGPGGTDRFGAELVDRLGDGPCWARDLKTTSVITGDYELVAAP